MAITCGSSFEPIKCEGTEVNSLPNNDGNDVMSSHKPIRTLWGTRHNTLIQGFCFLFLKVGKELKCRTIIVTPSNKNLVTGPRLGNHTAV